MYLIIDISDFFLLKYATILNLIDLLFSKMEIYAAEKKLDLHTHTLLIV